MPIVAIGVERLNRLLAKDYSMDLLVDALEQIGCDVEDTAEVAQYRCPTCSSINQKLPHEPAPQRCDICGFEGAESFPQVGTTSVIRLDLLADRPDLCDVGGLARALKGFLGFATGLPVYKVESGSIKVEVDERLSRPESFRPHIVCAEVEVPPLDEEELQELMRLQESLHWGIGRDRKLCSIGVYDLDAVTPPIRYTVIEPEGTRFVPLACGTREMTAREILSEHPKGMGYAHLLDGLSAYPLLVDSEGQVLSMPPIINSEETRLKVGSTRLFVDVTGIVEDAPAHALHTLLSSLMDRGARVVRTVRISKGGEETLWPRLEPGRHEIDLRDARRWLGLEQSDAELIELLRKMRLDVEGKGPVVTVLYPAFRTDIRHPVDLYADLSIGFGYSNFELPLVPTMTVSEERPEEKLTDRVRRVMLGLSYWEILSLVQTTEDKHFTSLRLTPEMPHAVIGNPKTSELSVVRCHLMTGLLETLQKNRRKSVPQHFFEVGNVVLLDSSRETGTREERRLAFAVIGPEAGYAAVRSVTDGLCHELGLKGEYSPEEHPTFIKGRCAALKATSPDGLEIAGRLGEVHPEVLESFSLSHHVALAELSLCPVV